MPEIARLHTKEALKYVQALQFEKADACLKEAKKEITQAHAAQTEIISGPKHGVCSMNTACCSIMRRTH